MKSVCGNLVRTGDVCKVQVPAIFLKTALILAHDTCRGVLCGLWVYFRTYVRLARDAILWLGSPIWWTITALRYSIVHVAV